MTTKIEKYDRIGHVVGVAFLLMVMFQPVAEGSTSAFSVASSSTNITQHNETASVNASKIHTDMNQLAALNVDSDLKEFIGSLVIELRELKRENALVKGEIVEIRNENVEMKGTIMELQQENVKMHETSNITRTETKMLTAQVLEHGEQLDQCKEETSSFVREMERRRLQTEEHCHGVAMQTMLATCCPSEGGGGHRRELQSDNGCAAFPDTCSSSCATVFTEFYQSCHESIVAIMPIAEQTQFDGFYSACTEAAQQAAAALEGASPAMIFHVVVIDQEAEQQGAMINGGSSSGTSHFGPVDLPQAPAPAPASGAVAAQEFRVVCTAANLTVCTPACNSFTYGFLLSIEIEGRGTVMTCNLVDGFYAWQGQASLGGFIGDDHSTFISSINSGAAGTFVLRLKLSLSVLSALNIRAGQLTQIHGDRALPAPPTWGNGGFVTGESGSLTLDYLRLLGPVSTSAGDAQLHLSECVIVSDGSFVPVSVATGGTAVITRTSFRMDVFYGFSVLSGPCTVQRGGMCFGRPDSYQVANNNVGPAHQSPFPSHGHPGYLGPHTGRATEHCDIRSLGSTTLGACPIFRLDGNAEYEYLSVEGVNTRTECPEGLKVSGDPTSRIDYWGSYAWLSEDEHISSSEWQVCSRDPIASLDDLRVLVAATGSVLTISGSHMRIGDLDVDSGTLGVPVTPWSTQIGLARPPDLPGLGNTLPLPCTGVWPHCSAGSRVVRRLQGPTEITMGTPLVCDGNSVSSCTAVPSGVADGTITAAQLAAGLDAGIPVYADRTCFVADYLMVPDDDESMLVTDWFTDYSDGRGSAPDLRCDEAEGSRHESLDGVTPRHDGHGPFGLHQSVPRWYRFPHGKGLLTQPVGRFHCHTMSPMWLRNDNKTLPPPVGSPPVDATICVGQGCGELSSTPARSVSCGNFTLWELGFPPAESCEGGSSAAYCLGADSGAQQELEPNQHNARCDAACAAEALLAFKRSGSGTGLENWGVGGADPCGTVEQVAWPGVCCGPDGWVPQMSAPVTAVVEGIIYRGATLKGATLFTCPGDSTGAITGLLLAGSLLSYDSNLFGKRIRYQYTGRIYVERNYNMGDPIPTVLVGDPIDGRPNYIRFLDESYNSTQTPFYGLTGDIATLGPLNTLVTLDLGNTNVEGDLDALSGMDGMTHLDLGNTNVVGDLASLSGMARLKYLDLHTTGPGDHMGHVSNNIYGSVSALAGCDLTGYADGPHGLYYRTASLNLKGCTRVTGWPFLMGPIHCDLGVCDSSSLCMFSGQGDHFCK
eukprot:SAG31_NODE_2085_length_6489_cov_4.027700_2_plen_1273_part_00